MKSKHYLAGLQERLAEIDALLGDYRDLLEERRAIETLLAKHKRPAKPINNLVKLPAVRVRSQNGPFVPNPASLTSRQLAAADGIMRTHDWSEAPFDDVFKALPNDLNGGTKERDTFRSGLIKAGKRVNLAYEKRPDRPYIVRTVTVHLAQAGNG